MPTLMYLTSFTLTILVNFTIALGEICTDNKQLLDEVEHDIMNYQNRSLCYLPKPKAEADNTDTFFT